MKRGLTWKGTLVVIFVASLALTALSSAVGLSYWAPLKSNMHAEIRLDSADSLLKFAQVIDKDVIYSFDVFWPMKPGRTTISAHVEKVTCQNSNYTIQLITMDGKSIESNGSAVFTINRNDPFLYLHVKLTLPPKCRVLPSEKGPVVVIDAETK